jgi:hypothetical protein
MVDFSIFMNILMGLFFGAQASLIGYMASNDLPQSWTVIFTKKFWSCFEPVKALKTVLLGGIMGAIGVVVSLNLMSSAESIIIVDVLSTITILGVDKLVKFIVRRTPIVTAWNWIKEKFSLFGS